MDYQNLEIIKDVRGGCYLPNSLEKNIISSVEKFHCAIAEAHVLPSRALDRKHVEGERQNVNIEHERYNKAGQGAA